MIAVAVAFAADGLHQLGVGDHAAHYAVLAWNGAVQAATSLAIVATLGALRERLEREEQVARTDALTRIANRRAFFEAAALILADTDAAQAGGFLQRLRAAVVEVMARGRWHVGISIGAATFLSPPASVDEMMARADELMYVAKRDEKGSIRRGVFPGVAAGGAAGP